mgnify:CR=1 FL=1
METKQAAMGGTELMMERLNSTLPPELLKQFQIIPSRVRALDETKHKVLWLHDLPQDPEVLRISEGWWRKRFDSIVMVMSRMRS